MLQACFFKFALNTSILHILKEELRSPCTAVYILSTCFFFQRRLNLSAAVFECFEVGSAQELRAIWRYIKSQHVKRNTPSTAYAKGGPWYVTVYRKVEPAFAIGDSVPKYDKYTCRLVATTSLIFSTSRKGYFTKASPHMEQSSLEALAPSKGNKPTSSYHPA